MKRHSQSLAPGPTEYRLNPEVIYFKFIKKNEMFSTAAITIPLEHLQKILGDKKSRGPRGGLKVSCRALNGSYMRSEGSIDLIRSGYIGAYAKAARTLPSFANDVIKGNRSLVFALQQYVQRI